MPLTPTTHADVTTKEQPGSPVVDFRQGQDSIERKFRGLWEDLLSKRASDWYDGAVMSDLTGILAGYVIDQVKLTADRGPGGLGTAQITLLNWESLSDSIYEVEWFDLTKDILAHPRYRSGGAKALTADDLNAIEHWKREDDYNAKTVYKFYATQTLRDAGNLASATALSANATDYAGKFLIGEENFMDSYPIVHATSYHYSRPTVRQTWKREDPSSGAGKPSGYEWMLTASGRTKRRYIWEKRESWSGALKWDAELYTT